MIRKLKIGSVELRNNLALAPMAGITNAAFRSLCIEGGAGLVVSEMVSAESIRYGNKKSLKLLEIYPSEHPIAMQLFGADPGSMARAAKLAEELGADIIDINAGCPVKKVLRSGAGAALMKEPLILDAIVKKTVKAVSVPVTVKIRCGLVSGEVISPRLALVIESAGGSAITLHGRPASSFHTGPVDFDALAATAAAVRIPIFGNGGARTAADAARILGTGCAGVAIGRAAVENPSVFSEIAEGLKGAAGGAAPDPARRIKLFIRFLELNAALYGGDQGVVRARKLVGYWLKGFPDSSALRGAFMKTAGLNEAKALLLQYMRDAKYL
ncbi:MAG TPA: tRNA dihydrouridine synthase DusB [Elusimicrobia bacterium]|nr:tRNA dihydrouridine synthase DusB [Elusimicrobiota bacterium]HBW22187.1 tRNA dihydrouridine synthase DusB [Elusimicrobiota bacterium]